MRPIDWMKAVAASDLDTTSKMIAVAIALRIDMRTQEAWPSIPTICADTSCRSKNTVNRHIAELLEQGWLSRRRYGSGRGQGYRYRLLAPVDNPALRGQPLTPLKGSTIDPLTQEGVNPRTKRGQLTNEKGSILGCVSVEQNEQTREPPRNGASAPVENLRPLLDFPADETLADYWRRVNGKNGS